MTGAELLREAAAIADGTFHERPGRAHVVALVAEVRKLREWQHYANQRLDRFDRQWIEQQMDPVHRARIGARAVEIPEVVRA